MEINLNPFDKASIDAAIQQLTEYKKRMEDGEKNIREAVINKGVELAKERVPIEWDGNEVTPVDIRATEDGIVAGGDAYFIEFGTGIVGENSPHPSPEWLARLANASSYNTGYNTGRYIIHGDKVNENTGYTDFWYYDHRTEVTSGIPATPFLYETVVELKERLPEIIKEALNGKGQDE